MAINIIDRGLTFQSNHSVRDGAPKGIVLHHAAGDGSVEQIHQIHRHRGYAGIGYHLYVRRDGKVYRGRPESWLGGHAQGFNDCIGVCAEGNFENETMSAAQQQAIVETLRYLFEKYGNLAVVGHRDVNATACPGKNYPLTAMVRAAKSQTSASGVCDLVKAFQEAAVVDGVSVGPDGVDGLWGENTRAAAAKLLENGSRGERVRVLQTRLLDAGYDLGEAGVDGIFGENTERAVRAFQKANGLTVDGLVGINTWSALLEV